MRGSCNWAPPISRCKAEIVGQANLSAQRGAAIAIAEAGEVSVTSWNDPAGGNGIVATSSAIAEGPVVQTAEQSNENSAEATFEGSQADAVAEAQDDGGLGVAGAGQLDGFDVALQGQIVGQVNLSAQGGLAVATASADKVTVDQARVLEAGKSGILATSSAQAAAPVVQTASQSNDNSGAATFEGSQASSDVSATEVGKIGFLLVPSGDLALQGQLVGQINLNLQKGAAIALASSDKVIVDQFGTLTTGADGVVATSSAEAGAAVVQTADQGNANSADQTFEPSEIEMTVNDETDSFEIDDGNLGLQGQLAGQLNLNAQRGFAVAEASSEKVRVKSQIDPAGGDGIRATSSAEGGAAVVQTANQSNSNGAEIEGTDGSEPTDEGTLGIQLQGALQGNLSLQQGFAIAEVESGPVEVIQDGTLTAGGNGIIAKSSAAAGALVAQTANQSNDNEGEIDLEQIEGPEDTITQVNGDGLDSFTLQGQAIGQLNANLQSGQAVAFAVSDKVTVDRTGRMEAGGDGIVAISSAAAGAAVVQSAEQTNSNELEAEGAEVALQGQLAGQLNANFQEGFALAVAEADKVIVKSADDPAGGNGIVASSTATSEAIVNQSVYQKNENELETEDVARGGRSAARRSDQCQQAAWCCHWCRAFWRCLGQAERPAGSWWCWHQRLIGGGCPGRGEPGGKSVEQERERERWPRGTGELCWTGRHGYRTCRFGQCQRRQEVQYDVGRHGHPGCLQRHGQVQGGAGSRTI